MANNQALFGKCKEAQENAKLALSYSRGRISLMTASLVFVTCNEVAQAQSLVDESTKRFPLDTPTVSIAAPLIRPATERGRGNFEQALQTLETIRTYDMSFIVGSANNYLRGQVYLDLKRGAEAAREFQIIISRPGVEIFGPSRAPAHLRLARAAAMSGDLAASRKAYQDFFGLWKGADQDLPLLAQARKEYESLK